MIPKRFRILKQKVNEMSNIKAEKDEGLKERNDTTMTTNDDHADNLPMICSLHK